VLRAFIPEIIRMLGGWDNRARNSAQDVATCEKARVEVSRHLKSWGPLGGEIAVRT
jgi:hypothetical protein